MIYLWPLISLYEQTLEYGTPATKLTLFFSSFFFGHYYATKSPNYKLKSGNMIKMR
jgi:hypothetical protein